MKLIKGLIPFVLILGLVGCQGISDKELSSKVAKILKENPKVLTEAIEANPADFVESFQKAIRNAQSVMEKKRREDEKKKLEATYDKPLVPEIRKDESFMGPNDAPLTLVEYSDFECPFCSRGYKTVRDLMNKYKGKIRVVYKHLPLSFHKSAMLAAQYYEAIRLQDAKKAYKFHDMIFENQRGLKKGEKFLRGLAKKVGANMKKIKKDLNSKFVMERIEQDKKEAAKFGMQGTPGFLLNGIPVKGAYPASHFYGIVDELVKRGKLKL